ncbi:MAG: CDP-glycerol glycerophosphotransferase family protein [Simkania sp.]|nr:CDP-glycerol glycerophosphotransferase family protein [Simkania sp.]
MLDLAAFLYGPALHHLDHLAPLCQTLDIPLFLTDDDIADLALQYYPRLQLQRLDRLEAAHCLINNYSTIISCLPRANIDQLFFFAKTAAKKNIASIWCPHGQSDKGHISGFMKTLEQERALLVYGPKMLEQLRSYGILEKLRGYAAVGNYRYEDYLIHQTTYDSKTLEALKPLHTAKRTYLYAPTWNDSEESSSFLTAYPLLIEHLPNETNLIIKPHPNLVIQHHHLFDKIREELFGHPHILLLENFPLVFPLLSQCDVYLGDASSVGYDCLAFDKPMIFLNENKRDPKLDQGLYLFRCGIHLIPEEYPQIYSRIENLLPYDQTLFSETRREVYDFAFNNSEETPALKQKIETLLTRIAEDDFTSDFLE